MRLKAVSILALAAALLAGGAHAKDVLVYFGTHGVEPAEIRPGQPVPEKGIYAARFDEETGRLTPLGLAVGLERPTWMAANPAQNLVYAVNELGNDGKSDGEVLALKPDGAGKLSVLSRIDARGGGTTNLTYDARSRTLFAANYGGGQAVSFPVAADGAVGEAVSVMTDTGSGPSPRQKSPHAHGVTVDPSGRFLLTPDLGADKVFINRIGPNHTLSPSDPAFAALPPGTGPRHIVFAPDGEHAYLISELTDELRVYDWDAGKLTLKQTVTATAPDWYGVKSGGDLVVSRDGRFLYQTNRGEDTVAVWAIDAQTGELSPLQRVAAQGDQPWHLSLDPTGAWLLVADEASSRVAVFGVDPATGRLTPTPNMAAIPKPVNILFAP